MSWRDKAACLGEDPDLFFPVGTTGPAADQADWAKAICADCPVRDACLDWAVTHGELGIWGGTDEDARARIRRKGVARRSPGQGCGHFPAGKDAAAIPHRRKSARAGTSWFFVPDAAAGTRPAARGDQHARPGFQALPLLQTVLAVDFLLKDSEWVAM